MYHVCYLCFIVRKRAKIRIQYNQVPHLSQDTTWKSDKHTIRHHKQGPRGQPFPSRGQQGINKKMPAKAQDRNNTNDAQKNYHLGTCSNKIINKVAISRNVGTFQKNITAEVKRYHMITIFYHMLPKNPLIHLQDSALINLYLVRHALAPMTC